MATVNPFLALKPSTRKIKVEALDGAEVEIRDLTVKESADLFKMLLNDKGEFTSKNSLDIRTLKVSMCMVQPKMSVDELSALGAKANKAIAEISDAIDSQGEDGLDEEGN